MREKVGWERLGDHCHRSLTESARSRLVHEKRERARFGSEPDGFLNRRVVRIGGGRQKRPGSWWREERAVRERDEEVGGTRGDARSGGNFESSLDEDTVSSSTHAAGISACVGFSGREWHTRDKDRGT